jgi:hypothetical protein
MRALLLPILGNDRVHLSEESLLRGVSALAVSPHGGQ